MLSLENASWQIAMLLTSLTLTVVALLFFRYRINPLTKSDTTQQND